jgi:hypothetical protein
MRPEDFREPLAPCAIHLGRRFNPPDVLNEAVSTKRAEAAEQQEVRRGREVHSAFEAGGAGRAVE